MGNVDDLRREAPQTCEVCGHPFGPHRMFVLGETVTDGGLFVCNVAGCSCTATWGVSGRAKPPLPDTETVQRLREFAQGERHWDEP